MAYNVPSTRNRIIYNVLGIYVGQVDPVTGNHIATGTNIANIKQLSRVQNFDEDFSRNLTNVNQYGQLAAIDRLDLQAPTVKANYSYLITDGSNEDFIGFDVNTGAGTLISCVSGILNNTTDALNYFLTVADEGNDTVGYKGINTGVIGVGNCYLTDYSVEAAVGQLPKASVSLEGLNINVIYPMQGGGSDIIPSVNPLNGVAATGGFVLPAATQNNSSTQVTALQPGQMTLNFSGVLGFSAADLKVQSFKLNIPLARKPLLKLGSKFAFSRVIDFPVQATFSIDAEIGSLQTGLSIGGYQSNNLANALCDTGVYNFQVAFQNPNCLGTGTNALLYQFNNCRLMSQKVSTSIGSNAKLTAEWMTQIGGPQDTVNGVFMSGSYPVL